MQKYLPYIIILLFCKSLSASPLTADIVFAKAASIDDLSLRSIEIDSDFNGTKMLLFGARYDAGEIIVVIKGPKLSYTIRQKEKVAGIWVNKKHKSLEDVPGFYAISASKPLQNFENVNLLYRLGILNVNSAVNDFIDINRTNKFVKDNVICDDNYNCTNLDESDTGFLKALYNHQEKVHLYQTVIGEINFIGDSLFRTVIEFPDNIPRGTYSAEVYLFSEGNLIGMQSTPLKVMKTGFDAILFELAYKYSFLYGLLAVGGALLAGWIAGLIFKKV